MVRAEKLVDAIACRFNRGEGFVDALAKCGNLPATGHRLTGDFKESGHQQPPEQLLILFANDVEVTLGLVRAGQPAHIGIGPERGSECNGFIVVGSGALF